MRKQNTADKYSQLGRRKKRYWSQCRVETKI